MKKKVAFWVVMILANAVIVTISIRTYQNMNARVNFVESYQRNLAPYLFEDAKKLEQLESAHKKTVTELLKILGVDGSYDFNNNLVRVWDLNKFFDHKAEVKTSVTLEIPKELQELSSDPVKNNVRPSKAPAMIIGRYVLMASHTNYVESFSRQKITIMAPFGILEQIFEFKVLEYNVTLLMTDGSERLLKELYRNKEKDFSLFEMPALSAGGPENIKAPNFPFEIGKSDELKIGHFIYMNGRPGIDSEVARPGFVTSLVSVTLGGALGVKKDINEFGLSQSTDQGDSGSPIVAFRDGRPELVGIYLGWVAVSNDDHYRNIRSRALKINVAIDEIKEKLGLDLRELQHQILSQH